MNAFTRHAFASAIAAAALVASSAGTASAQTIGTFPFALQPFCNVIQLTVTQEGNTYRLAGWDDACGATTRQPVFGTIAPNGDGTLHLGFTTMRSNGVAVETSIRNLSIGGYTGSWSDSAGNAGTAVIVGVSGAVGTGGARPGPSSSLLPNSVSTGTIVDGAVTSPKIVDGAVTGAKIVDGAVGLAKINTAEVQQRVTGTCGVGTYVRSIDVAGNVVCGVLPTTQSAEGTVSISLATNSCNDVASLSFGNVAAGTLTCDGVLRATLNHTTDPTDPSRIEVDFADVAATCAGDFRAGTAEIPAQLGSFNGFDVSVPVKRSFPVAAGPLVARMNVKLRNATTGTALGYGLTCTFTPQ